MVLCHVPLVWPISDLHDLLLRFLPFRCAPLYFPLGFFIFPWFSLSFLKFPLVFCHFPLVWPLFRSSWSSVKTPGYQGEMKHNPAKSIVFSGFLRVPFVSLHFPLFCFIFPYLFQSPSFSNGLPSCSGSFLFLNIPWVVLYFPLVSRPFQKILNTGGNIT